MPSSKLPRFLGAAAPTSSPIRKKTPPKRGPQPSISEEPKALLVEGNQQSQSVQSQSGPQQSQSQAERIESLPVELPRILPRVV